MSDRHTIIYIARVILEAATPLSISTGNPDGVFDTALVRDANGLPAIPGTSLAGVLRHLCQSQYGQSDADDLFGHQSGNNGQPSRLEVSWGALLDSQGQPAEGLLLGEAAKRLDQDPLFKSAREQIDAPVYRNRVRLSHKGTAENRGKFDRAVLPAGHRFAVELRLRAPAGDDGSDWQRLLDLLHHPGFRLGGATRAGLGRMAVISIHQNGFDLRSPDRAAAFLQLGRDLNDTRRLEQYTPKKLEIGNWLTGTLYLTPRGLWRIGQGNEPLDKTKDKPADLMPVTESRIDWSGGKGEIKPHLLLVPAASIKGALAHRIAFHANCLAGQWADEVEPQDFPVRPAAVEALLGNAKDRAQGKASAPGRAGALFIDDTFVAVDADKVARLMHNVIDRFTGGVRNRMLFEEESLYKGKQLEIPMAIDVDRFTHEPDARRAFSAALDDLCQGRLALGSRTSSGNGYFTGELTGELKAWLDQQDNEEEAYEHAGGL